MNRKASKGHAVRLMPIILILMVLAILFTVLFAFPMDILGRFLPDWALEKIEEIRGLAEGRSIEEIKNPPETIEKHLGAVYEEQALNEEQETAREPVIYDKNELIEIVCAALDERQMTITLNNVTYDEINEVMNEVYKKPEYFWLNREYYTSVTDNGSIKISVTSNFEDIDLAWAQINEAAGQILGSAASQTTDYRKARAIYEGLIDRISYNRGEQAVNDGNIYGALVEGSCVCEGYAESFVYLMGLAGIDAQLYTGTANSGGVVESHAWNSAVLNGELYYFDVTWADQDNGVIYYDWFALTSRQMERTHFPDEESPMPETDATACNYYYLNDLILYSPDIGELENMIANQGNNVDIMCADSDIYGSIAEIIENADKMSLICSDIGLTATGYTYSENDSLYTFKLSFY